MKNNKPVPKKRSDKYQEKLSVKTSFSGLMKIVIKNAKKKNTPK